MAHVVNKCMKGSSMMIEDGFKQILMNHGLKVIYTSNKKVALSCREKDGKLTVYANRIFRDCPEEIANAVLNLYLIENYDVSDYITNFVETFNPDYKIIQTVKLKDKKQKEMAINGIVLSNFKNDQIQILGRDQTFRVNGDDALELEITVEPKTDD